MLEFHYWKEASKAPYFRTFASKTQQEPVTNCDRTKRTFSFKRKPMQIGISW